MSITKTLSESEMAKMRFVKGRVHLTARYDLHGTTVGPSPVLTVYLNDDPVFEIVFQPGETTEREITVPLDLTSRGNKLRLICALYGPSPSTTAQLILTDDGRPVLTARFETDRDVETIDQSWTIQRAGG